MNVVFADSFYFIARLNKRDQYHEQALALSRELRAKILTSDWITTEVADALAQSECRPRIRDFILHLRESSNCEVVPLSREIFDQALELYHRHADKGWWLTDCTSMVIMRERGLQDVLTGDKHFEQAGFTALLKSDK